jgi:WD40 repeat protein
VWDVGQKNLARTWTIPGGSARRPTLSADGEQLAVLMAADGGGKVVVLHMATLTERLSFSLGDTGDVESLALSPDKQLLAVGTGRDLRLWGLANGKERGVLAAAHGEAEV